jgi:hypothetical protein
VQRVRGLSGRACAHGLRVRFRTYAMHTPAISPYVCMLCVYTLVSPYALCLCLFALSSFHASCVVRVSVCVRRSARHEAHLCIAYFARHALNTYCLFQSTETLSCPS